MEVNYTIFRSDKKLSDFPVCPECGIHIFDDKKFCSKRCSERHKSKVYKKIINKLPEKQQELYEDKFQKIVESLPEFKFQEVLPIIEADYFEEDEEETPVRYCRLCGIEIYDKRIKVCKDCRQEIAIIKEKKAAIYKEKMEKQKAIDAIIDAKRIEKARLEKQAIAKAKEEAKQMAIQKWIDEKHKCETCGKVMTEKYASGRFCCLKCARVPSKETLEKMSNSQRGKQKSKEHKQKISESAKGKKVSDNTKKRMSDSHKGCRLLYKDGVAKWAQNDEELLSMLMNGWSTRK